MQMLDFQKNANSVIGPGSKAWSVAFFSWKAENTFVWNKKHEELQTHYKAVHLCKEIIKI